VRGGVMTPMWVRSGVVTVAGRRLWGVVLLWRVVRLRRVGHGLIVHGHARGGVTVGRSSGGGVNVISAALQLLFSAATGGSGGTGTAVDHGRTGGRRSSVRAVRRGAGRGTPTLGVAVAMAVAVRGMPYAGMLRRMLRMLLARAVVHAKRDGA